MPETLRDVPPPLLSSETSPTLLDSHNRCRRLSETSLLLSCPPRRPRLYWTLITGAGALRDVPSPPPVLRDVPPTLRTLITGAGALRDVPSPPPVLRDCPSDSTDSHNRCRRLSETSLLLSCPPRRPRLYWTLITGAGALRDVPSPPPVLRDVPPTLRTLITGAGDSPRRPSSSPVLRDVPDSTGLS